MGSNNLLGSLAQVLWNRAIGCSEGEMISVGKFPCHEVSKEAIDVSLDSGDAVVELRGVLLIEVHVQADLCQLT